MRLTKYEHACFTVEQDGKMLVVDPGAFTADLTNPENVVAIVITHEHTDHFDPTALGALIAHNPDAVIIGHENITRQLGDVLPTQAVHSGEMIKVGPFTLEFFSGEHAQIHSSIPIIPNLGVMVNDTLYYPGDSFISPDKPVKVLALPAAAPWMKISEAIDFISLTKPRFVFPTHDAILSDIGKNLVDQMIVPAVGEYGGTYQRLTQPVELESLLLNNA